MDPKTPSAAATTDADLLVARTAALEAEIDEHRRIEARLQASEEHLRLALQAAHLGTWRRDLQTQEIFWSEACSRLLGFPCAKDLSFERFLAAVHPDDRSLLSRTVTQAIATRSEYRLEYRLYWPDGSLHWFSATARVHLGADGEPRSLDGIVGDITERKQGEEALHRLHAILEAALSAMSDAVFVCDTAGELIYFNDAFAAFHRFENKDACAGTLVDYQRFLDLHLPDGTLVPLEQWPVARALRGEAVTGAEYQLSRKDTDETWIGSFSFAPIRAADGTLIGSIVTARDVTEDLALRQVLTEERANLEVLVAERTAELQSSEAKLRTIYDVLPVGISITDPAGHLVDCNRASEELLGLSKTTQLHRTYDGPEWTLVRPDGTLMPPDEYASVRAMREQREVHDCEMGVVRPEQTTWISVSAMPAGHPDYGVVIAYVDITDRKQIEEEVRSLNRALEQRVTERTTELQDANRALVDARRAALNLMEDAIEARGEAERALERLALSEERFREMAETIGDVFWVTSPDSQSVLYVSPAFESIWGYSCDEVYARPSLWFECVDPHYQERVTAAVAAITTGGSYDEEYPIRRPDGELRWIQDRGYSVSDAQGAIVRLTGIASDITARRAMQGNLRASEERFRNLYAQSSEALLLFTEEGFVDCNPAALNLFGYDTREALLGRNPIDLSPPTQPDGADSRERIADLTARVLREGHLSVEWLCRHRDGALFLGDVRLSRIEIEGRSAIQGSIRDISERQAMLTALTAAKGAAEQANRAKSMFLANMSHEIRTPMNAIVGFTELALAAAPPPVDGYLGKIRAATDHLLHLIDDILDFSRIEAGHLTLAAEPFALGDVLDGLRSLLTARAEAKGLSLHIDQHGLGVRTLVGDAGRLGQILVNLVGNAIKFTDHGAIAVRVAAADADDRGGGVPDERLVLHFTVRDQGIGIDPAVQDRLFQSFVQADAGTTRRFGGTGLGLAICRHLVEAMGGHLWVESRPGVGSTFHFTAVFGLTDQAPARRQPRGLAALDPALVAGLRGIEVLVVEDVELGREVAAELLGQLGVRVRLAADGAQALAALEEARPDAVFMDCQMPVMDGFETTARLRARPEWRTLPVIALTANAFGEDRRRCLAAGMDDFVAKPVDIAELAAALTRQVRPRPGETTAPLPASSVVANISLPDLPGIDTAAGLAFIGGNRGLYADLLRRFRDTGAADFAAEIGPAIHATDFPKICGLAHKLKGSARTLGAAALGTAAERLEQAARAADALAMTQAQESVEQELRKVLTGLATLPAPMASAPTDAAACHQVITVLRALLADGDSAALDHLETLRAATAGTGREAQAEALAQALLAFRFEEAATALERLAVSLGDGPGSETP